MNAPTPSVAPLDDSQKEAAATTLARAFFEDPGYRYIFPGDAVRSAGLEFIYARVVNMLQPLGATLTLREGPGAPSSGSPPGSPRGTRSARSS